VRKNNTIAHREEFRGAQRQIAELEDILAEMQQEETPESYKILCKNYVRRIRQIQSEIDEYLGITHIRVA
jgi:hypothetical protein